MPWLPEHIDWAIPCYWVGTIAVIVIGAWLIDKNGQKPRT